MDQEAASDTSLDYEDDLSSISSGTTQYETDSSINPSPVVSEIESNDEQEEEVGDNRIVIMNNGEDDNAHNYNYAYIDGEVIHDVDIHPDDNGAEMVVLEYSLGTVCPVCPATCRRLKRHMLVSHLPWYIRGPSACFSCKAQCGTFTTMERQHRNCPYSDLDLIRWVGYIHTVFLKIAEYLGLPNVNCLLHYVRHHRLYPVTRTRTGYNSPFDPLEEVWMRRYEYLQSPDRSVNQQFRVSPPNRVISLCHWRTVYNLLMLLPHDTRVYLYNMQ